MDRITPYLVDDHRRLETLLAEDYEAFRAGLLRHIAIEEKLLFPAVRAALGRPIAAAAEIRTAHGRIAALLAVSPSPERLAELTALLAAHDAVEEGPDGAYAECEAALDEDASRTLLERARAYPAVRVGAYRDLIGIIRPPDES